MGLGEYIRHLRTDRGIDQQVLAARLGVHPSYVCRLERSKRCYVGTGMRDRLALALGLSTAEVNQLDQERQLNRGVVPLVAGTSAEAVAVLQQVAALLPGLDADELDCAAAVVRSLQTMADKKSHKGRGNAVS